MASYAFAQIGSGDDSFTTGNTTSSESMFT